jgi:hypothetical protein
MRPVVETGGFTVNGERVVVESRGSRGILRISDDCPQIENPQPSRLRVFSDSTFNGLNAGLAGFAIDFLETSGLAAQAAQIKQF